MNIYINGRFLTQPMTGVARYAYNICKALTGLGYSFTLICPHRPILSCYNTEGFNIIHFGVGTSHFWEQCILPFFFVFRKKCLLLSLTGLGTILVRRKVMAIHDLAFLRNPSWYSFTYYWFYKIVTPIVARLANRIITVSNFSKSEILKFYRFLKEDKICVVYNAVNREQFKKLNYCENIEESAFVLAVSSIDPRKNFTRLIEAFEGIKTAKLYIVGAYNRVFQEQKELKHIPENVHFLGRIEDEQLVRLYNNAECFIFPSLYEGFGLPPLEAMACGCPVLVSDIPVEREVCGEAAQYFNPLDTKDIHDAICRYLDETKEMKALLQERGYDNLKRFSWDQSASCIMQIIDKIRV